MRLAFMGTPDFAVPALEALVAAGHSIEAVYSRPPARAGRGHHLQPSPVHARAEALGLAVHTPSTLKDPAEQQRFASLDLDAAIVAAYGMILPAAMLAAPVRGCLNIHASLLPRWRGAAPIQRAILAGDTETGISIMQMEAGLDTGPVLLTGSVAIGAETTAVGLTATLATLGASLIVSALEGLAAGNVVPVPQPAEGVTYAAKLAREEGRLDWRHTAGSNERKVRALNPAPGVWFDDGAQRIKVLAASAESGDAGKPGTVIDGDFGIACAEGIFRPILLQRPGRGAVAASAFLNGSPIRPGTVLPCPAID
jgi:methionyl-tRNA formyltransferase